MWSRRSREKLEKDQWFGGRWSLCLPNDLTHHRDSLILSISFIFIHYHSILYLSFIIIQIIHQIIAIYHNLSFLWIFVEQLRLQVISQQRPTWLIFSIFQLKMAFWGTWSNDPLIIGSWSYWVPNSWEIFSHRGGTAQIPQCHCWLSSWELWNWSINLNCLSSEMVSRNWVKWGSQCWSWKCNDLKLFELFPTDQEWIRGIVILKQFVSWCSIHTLLDAQPVQCCHINTDHWHVDSWKNWHELIFKMPESARYVTQLEWLDGLQMTGYSPCFAYPTPHICFVVWLKNTTLKVPKMPWESTGIISFHMFSIVFFCWRTKRPENTAGIRDVSSLFMAHGDKRPQTSSNILSIWPDTVSPQLSHHSKQKQTKTKQHSKCTKTPK